MKCALCYIIYKAPPSETGCDIKTTLTSTGLWIKHHARLHTIVALVVFGIGLLATLYYWKNLDQGVSADLQSAYTRQAQSVVDNVSARIRSYENFLRGSAGLFAIQTELTQAQWEKYHQPYSIAASYPDIDAIGVARYLTPDQLPAYMQRRADQGDANFAIFPAGDRSAHAPTTFEAQYAPNQQNDRGYDNYTDPVRHTAMDRAVETNTLTMSGKTTLPGGTRPTFLIYLPVYMNDKPVATAAQRQAGLLGFVYVSVDGQSFADAIFPSKQNPHFGIELFDAESSANNLLYKSSTFDSLRADSASQVKTTTVKLYNHQWRLTFAVSPDLLPARERQLPEQALWRGVVTCVFFAGLVWYLITDRERKYARQKREEVQTAKDDLLSLASHQLRTPATVVKQYVGMLLQGYGGKLSRRQMTMLNSAYESNERQLEIINQLLYVARLDAGRITLRPEKVDVVKLMRDVAHDQSATIEARHQHVRFSLPKRKLMTAVDPHYMRMVLENLLSNAIKYTAEGGAIILGARRDAAGVVLVVTDTGVGIESAAQKSIFEKFTRIENELTTDVNGSGVGLYLTKEIVELHGGRIEVQSVAGEGSSFIIYLPSPPSRKDDL